MLLISTWQWGLIGVGAVILVVAIVMKMKGQS